MVLAASRLPACVWIDLAGVENGETRVAGSATAGFGC